MNIPISTINKAIEQTDLNLSFVKPVDVTIFYGVSYARLTNKRGGHYLVTFVSNGKDVWIKAVLKIVRKWERYTYSINGQEGTNTKSLAWFHDGRGPLIQTKG